MGAEIIRLHDRSRVEEEQEEQEELVVDVKKIAKRLVRLKLLEDVGERYILTGDGSQVAVILNSLALNKATKTGVRITTAEELQNFLVDMEEG